MSDRLSATYQEVCQHARKIALFGSVVSVLEWDERTYLPQEASDYRAEQVSALAGVTHDYWTSPRFTAQLAELCETAHASDSTSDVAVNIRELARENRKRVKLPKSLVEELARASVVGQQRWVEARRDDDFELLRPTLETIVRLKRAEADALGYSETRYDALLDEFEPHESTSRVAGVFSALRGELIKLVQAIAGSPRRADVSILFRAYDVSRQQKFATEVARQIGFDFARGRLDTTAHPFCTHLGPNDVRLTTRYADHDFSEAFFGTLHEAGHGLYEQGLPGAEFGLPTGDAVSLGIHESQSRLWENLVGRSRAFWEGYFPRIRKAFPSALAEVGLDEFYFAINDVRPSLIRVEADEVTYNFHVFVRFELEQALLAGDLPVADLPVAWREQYREYLGIEPPDDKTGVLQDIHWSGGAIGYFPTYTLGNLYASQFFERAEVEIGSLDEQFRRGEFSPLLNWLREKIHRQGRRLRASELIERVTGQPLSHEPLMRHLWGKFGALYDVRP